MSAEVTVFASLEADNSEFDQILSVAGLRFDFSAALASQKYSKQAQTIGITEEALQLGETSGALGWCLIINRDNTNFVSLKTGTGGTIFAKLPPKGGCALFHFGSGVTAPYAIADTAAAKVEFLIFTA